MNYHFTCARFAAWRPYRVASTSLLACALLGACGEENKAAAGNSGPAVCRTGDWGDNATSATPGTKLTIELSHTWGVACSAGNCSQNGTADILRVMALTSGEPQVGMHRVWEYATDCSLAVDIAVNATLEANGSVTVEYSVTLDRGEKVTEKGIRTLTPGAVAKPILIALTTRQGDTVNGGLFLSASK